MDENLLSNQKDLFINIFNWIVGLEIIAVLIILIITYQPNFIVKAAVNVNSYFVSNGIVGSVSESASGDILSGNEIKTIIDSYTYNYRHYSDKDIELMREINERIEKEDGIYGVYIKDLKNGTTFQLGEYEKKYPPASTFKMYTSVLILQEIEKGKMSYSTGVTLTKSLVSPGPGTYFTAKNYGSVFTLKDILWRMIVQSDNTAQSMLFSKLGGRSEVEKLIKPNLNLENTSITDFHTTPLDMGIHLERLYRKELLNDENSQYLSDLMISGYARDRIKAGVPSGTKVANKGGTLDENKHDVAIVYGNKTDYILVVYSDKIVESKAVKTIVDLSKITWEHFDE